MDFGAVEYIGMRTQSTSTGAHISSKILVLWALPREGGLLFYHRCRMDCRYLALPVMVDSFAAVVATRSLDSGREERRDVQCRDVTPEGKHIIKIIFISA